MTVQEWLDSNDPRPMRDFLRGKASDRKLGVLTPNVLAHCREPGPQVKRCWAVDSFAEQGAMP
jgi:hypothetical protein